MASDGFSDKNVVFRKLKAKSENKVFLYSRLISIAYLNSFLFRLRIEFPPSDLYVSYRDLWFCVETKFRVCVCVFFFSFFRFVLIAMLRIRLGLLLPMGSSFVLIAPPFIVALASMLALSGDFSVWVLIATSTALIIGFELTFLEPFLCACFAHRLCVGIRSALLVSYSDASSTLNSVLLLNRPAFMF